MSTMKMLFRNTAVLVGASAALLIGGLIDGVAHADTGQPAVPGASAPNVVNQLAATAANAPQMLQGLATALGATPPAPAAPPPLASAGIRVPQPMPLPGMPGASPTAPAATVPGITSVVPAATPAVPGMPSLPGITSAVPGSTPVAPATGPAQLMPSAKFDLPEVPFLPVPLPREVSLPGDLASLATGGVAHPPTQPVFAPAAAGPVTGEGPLLSPLSALP